MTGRTILSVDDNPANRYLRSRALREAGFQVIEAATGQEALQMVVEQRPDLVLLDMKLPDISGLEVCRRIKLDPRTGRIPVIHISVTYVAEGTEATSFNAGADIYLAEPVGGQEIVTAVRTLIRLRATEAEREELLRRAQAAQRAAEDAARLKDEFLAVLSHELRTPMSAMIGWLDLIRTGRLTAEQQVTALETIDRNARLQTQLVNDLLDVSRIVTGKMELEPSPVRVDQALENALHTARIAAGEKGIELAAPREADGWVVKGSPERLQQVFSNLLSNALKFTPRGGRVEVRAETAGGEVRISVSDNGEGIAPDLLPHIFDRFRQADSSSRRRHGGLGLGLAIVRSLVELHGGRVTVASEGLGRGTTFTVTLPLITDPGRDPAARAGTSESGESLRGIRVLAVDDEEDAARMIEQMLRMEGASVRIATNGPDALAAAKDLRPDVLVLDIGMPIEDGYALLPLLRRELGVDAAGLPAIALTGFAGASDSERAREANFQEHVAKPFEMTAVCELIARLAAQSKRAR